MKTSAPILVLALVAASQIPQEAARLARAGDLEAAERKYLELLEASPLDATINYNLGTVLLTASRYDEARPYLERAAADSALTAAANYNLGNTDLQPAFEDSTLADRDARLRRAIEAYKESLLADPTDEDAKWNLELAWRLLERESPPPQSAGGGGGGGGGGDGPPATGESQTAPAPAGGQGSDPSVSESAAESLLREAQLRELEIQRDRLQKPLPPEGIRP